jgi:hypothetical protein
MAATVTRQPGKFSGTGNVYEILTIDWTSDGSGDATLTLDVNGFLVKAITDPVDGPTDNYDISLVQNGGDALGGFLADRDTTTTEVKIPTFPIFLAGSHVFTVAAAGATKSGICYLYLVEKV